jgi:hypothetical protein
MIMHPIPIVVHCMAHHTNLVVQALSMFRLVKHIENLLQTLHVYFACFLKRHLEFTKLAQMMETKGNKILGKIKIWWILMLSPVMVEYKTLLVKMAID